MAIRFSRPRADRAHRDRPALDSEAIGGPASGWAGIAILLGAALVVVVLAGSRFPGSSSLAGVSGSSSPGTLAPVDPTPAVLDAIAPSAQALIEVEAAFASLCNDAMLIALDLDPDCETGAIILADERFDGFGGAALTPDSAEDVAAAMRIYLARLQELPALWDSLDAIEFRGHSDPRAVRDPYVTNLVGSQQRPLGVLLHLVEEGVLSDASREALQKLAVVSGVSFSRPPATCPERKRECYSEWRRVEIRPLLSESLRRGDWARTIQAVQTSVQVPRDAEDRRLR